MQPGLNETTAVGRCGAYRKNADHANAVQLATCVARDMDFHAVDGGRIRWLGGPALPDAFHRRSLARSWTGRVYRYGWEGGGFDAFLKTTLPGPMFVPMGKTFDWRWAVDNGVPSARSLPEGRDFGCAWTVANPGQVVLLNNWTLPTLLVASNPIATMTWVSHEHMTLEFEAPSARVMLVPLLDPADIPGDIGPWLELIAAPPVSCREEFEVRDGVVALRQTFDGARVAPVPAVSGFSPLQRQPPARTLLHGLMGPYRVVPGDFWETEIPMDWCHARWQAVRKVEVAGLGPVPDELAYAGDVTWEPGSPMDQLLALRVWAPLAGVCPPSVWEAIRPRLTPPTAAQLRESLAVFAEPSTGHVWAKEAKLFETAGDVAYDSDWYNGFELSGMWRAANCPDPDIAGPARRLMVEARDARAHLASYYAIFHDWELGAAWTDARGVGWNADCSHNGLEGLLAQAAMCREEGDAKGADFVLYLAAKTANALLAAEWLVDYQVSRGFVHGPLADGPTFGMNGVLLNRGVVPDSPARKNPYAVAGNFPEFCALQRKFGRIARYREVADLWRERYPQRYADWVAFYCGRKLTPDQATMHSQEERVQAAVMYHLAPEIAFRLWTLGEAPDTVEGLYATPLNLAEQLLCRAGARLEAGDAGEPPRMSSASNRRS